MLTSSIVFAIIANNNMEFELFSIHLNKSILYFNSFSFRNQSASFFSFCHLYYVSLFKKDAVGVLLLFIQWRFRRQRSAQPRFQTLRLLLAVIPAVNMIGKPAQTAELMAVVIHGRRHDGQP